MERFKVTGKHWGISLKKALYDNPHTLRRELYVNGLIDREADFYTVVMASDTGIHPWDYETGFNWAVHWEDGQVQGDWEALGGILEMIPVDDSDSVS